MFIIFGTKSLGRTIQTGHFACRQCRVERVYQLKKYRRYFSLFFIPIIPLDNLGEYLICTGCHTHYLPQYFLTQNQTAANPVQASQQS